MTAKPPRKVVRCAIYTRVSTDQGLEQDFNSLDAQYDASQAYIRSQAHAGWTLLRAKFDDGGFSGGNTDRPALQRLLGDVHADKIDVIVVYKVDRLTRSLADFAKLVELFDQHDVSFVSVTQQFNTTTSMGRLTLNVLLSFAQFEREVTSERIRDKIAASKRKGLWVGGKVPLGYAVKDRNVIVVEREAAQVRAIFQRYLKLGSIYRLMPELQKRGIVTKVQALNTGKSIGGIPFTSGPLSYLLRNRFYVGEVVYKDEILPGPQAPILDRSLFDAVQQKLANQLNNNIATRSRSEALLIGKLFDDHGNPMSPSHTRKKGLKYRYYVSQPVMRGQPQKAGTFARVPALAIESLVVQAIRERIKPTEPIDDRALVNTHVSKVEVRADHLVILFVQEKRLDRQTAAKSTVVRIAWQKPPVKRRREILLPSDIPPETARPIRAERRATLVAAIARGRRWLNELVSDATATTETIANRERCTVRKINMTISLAFLAPDLVKAAIDGRLPHGLGLTRLCDLPPEWSRQRRVLGLSSPQTP